jgi:hypothetical protein
MKHVLRWFFTLVVTSFIAAENSYSLIGPVRILPSGNILLVPCDQIKLSENHIELYHHPLGIWLVEYRALLKNLYAQEIVRAVGFPAGFDMRLFEGDLYADRFENFKVYVNEHELTEIQFMIKCPNYVETTGTKWTADDGSGIGFLNTWELKFKSDEAKWIKVTFSFVVTRIPAIYNPDIKETWYTDLVNWVHQDYALREENRFEMPINIGSFWAYYPDSITIRTFLAHEWFKVIDKAERQFKKDLIQKYEFSEPIGFYTPPEVALDTLSIDQLQEMSSTELILLRNAFFAKYGRKFENQLIQKYFDHQPWYCENPKYHNWYLNQWDIENIRRIREYEKSLKKND